MYCLYYLLALIIIFIIIISKIVIFIDPGENSENKRIISNFLSSLFSIPIIIILLAAITKPGSLDDFKVDKVIKEKIYQVDSRRVCYLEEEDDLSRYFDLMEHRIMDKGEYLYIAKYSGILMWNRRDSYEVKDD